MKHLQNPLRNTAQFCESSWCISCSSRLWTPLYIWLPEASRCRHSHCVPPEKPKLHRHCERTSYCPNPAYKDQGESKSSSLNRSSKGQGRSSSLAPTLPVPLPSLGLGAKLAQKSSTLNKKEFTLSPAPLLQILCFAAVLLTICSNFLCFPPRSQSTWKTLSFVFCGELKEKQRDGKLHVFKPCAQKSRPWLCPW